MINSMLKLSHPDIGNIFESIFGATYSPQSYLTPSLLTPVYFHSIWALKLFRLLTVDIVFLLWWPISKQIICDTIQSFERVDENEMKDLQPLMSIGWWWLSWEFPQIIDYIMRHMSYVIQLHPFNIISCLPGCGSVEKRPDISNVDFGQFRHRRKIECLNEKGFGCATKLLSPFFSV
jgi:hypothetical protein